MPIARGRASRIWADGRNGGRLAAPRARPQVWCRARSDRRGRDIVRRGRRASRLSDKTGESKLRRIETGAEARIRELQEAGELSGLPGEGQPLPTDPDDAAGDAWAARHVVRTSGARPMWTELRREAAERRMRIVVRLRSHLVWLESRQRLLEHLPAERIVSELALTRQADGRVRAEVADAIAELNALVRHHNLVVTATALHLPTASLEGLIEVARGPRG
ncbi:MAG: DUF1992 domain-containing protein [Chloroflexi bacterium]|nr:MAG: DUF1992 domain-containing protein [Chloroflexota bacterium]